MMKKSIVFILTTLSIFLVLFTTPVVHAANIVDSQKSEAKVGFYVGPHSPTESTTSQEMMKPPLNHKEKPEKFPQTGSVANHYLVILGLLTLFITSKVIVDRRKKEF